MMKESFFIEEFASVQFQQNFFSTQVHENLGQIKNDEISFFGSGPDGQIGFRIVKVFMQVDTDDKHLIYHSKDHIVYLQKALQKLVIQLISSWMKEIPTPMLKYTDRL